MTFQQIMNYNLSNQHSFNMLKEQIATDSVVPFIGAGMSIMFGFPSWDKLILSLSEKAFSVGNNNRRKKKFLALINNANSCAHSDTAHFKLLLKGASLLRSYMGKNAYDRELSAMFKCNVNEATRFELLNQPIAYIPLLFPSRVIVSTNYEDWVNNYPRKIFNYKTAEEIAA